MNLQLDRYIFGDRPVLPNQPGNAYYCLVTHKQSKKQYILKIYSPQNTQESDRITLELHLNTQAQISKGVVQIFSFCQQSTRDTKTGITSTKINILMQYVSTNLRDIIAERKKINNYFSQEELERHLRQLLKTLAELQEAKISHGHIELEKIFTDQNNGDLLIGDFWNAQNLFDFESSEIVKIDYTKIQTCKFPDQESLLALIQGEDQYRANYYKQDVYSLGIVACQMATLKMYQNHFEFKSQQNADKKFILERYGQGVADLIDQLLAPRTTRQDAIQLYKNVEKYFKRPLIQIFEETRTPSPDRNNLQFSENNVQVGSNIRSDLSGSQSEDLNDRWSETDEIYRNSHFANAQDSMLLNTEVKHSNSLLTVPMNDSKTVTDDLVQQFKESSKIRNTQEVDLNNQQDFIQYQQSNVEKLNSLYNQYQAISSVKSKIKPSQSLNFTDFIKAAKSLPNLPWVDLNKLKMNESIGEGSRSSVYLCEVQPHHKFCVAKKYYENDNFKLLEILKILDKLNALDVKLAVKVEFFNIAPIQDDESKSELIIISKRKSFNLTTLVQNYRLCLRDKLKIATQIASILFEMHQKHVIHGALKPENILLDMQNNVFLTDYGYSEIPTTDNEQAWMCTSEYFEPFYSSPEQFNDLQICKNSDIWSLGIIIYEFIFETKATQDLIDYYKLYDPKIQGCIDIEFPSLIGLLVPFSKLIKAMTQFNPEKRMNLVDVKKELDLLLKSIKYDRQTQRINNQSTPQIQLNHRSESQPQLQIQQQNQQTQYQQKQKLAPLGQQPKSPATNSIFSKKKS